jgi:hypothetical protein
LPTATQIECILFDRAAKDFGIYQQKQLKLTVFCFGRAVKYSGIRQHKSNSLHFVLPRSENFWNFPTQKELKLTVFGSAAQREFLEINGLLICRATKYFVFCPQKELN